MPNRLHNFTRFYVNLRESRRVHRRLRRARRESAPRPSPALLRRRASIILLLFIAVVFVALESLSFISAKAHADLLNKQNTLDQLTVRLTKINNAFATGDSSLYLRALTEVSDQADQLQHINPVIFSELSNFLSSQTAHQASISYLLRLKSTTFSLESSLSKIPASQPPNDYLAELQNILQNYRNLIAGIEVTKNDDPLLSQLKSARDQILSYTDTLLGLSARISACASFCSETIFLGYRADLSKLQDNLKIALKPSDSALTAACSPLDLLAKVRTARDQLSGI